MRDGAKKALAAAIVGACILPIVGLSIDTSETMPDSAFGYLDQNTRTFFAQPCMEEWMNRPGMGTATVIQAWEARSRGYESDHACLESGAFDGAKSSVTRDVLVRFGLLSRPDEWWDATLADPAPVLVRKNAE